MTRSDSPRSDTGLGALSRGASGSLSHSGRRVATGMAYPGRLHGRASVTMGQTELRASEENLQFRPSPAPKLTPPMTAEEFTVFYEESTGKRRVSRQACRRWRSRRSHRGSNPGLVPTPSRGGYEQVTLTSGNEEQFCLLWS
jgi:hypothetical protein